MLKTIFAPKAIPADKKYQTLFMGGAIDMGRAEPWQERLTQALTQTLPKQVQEQWLLLNPRRPDWNSAWAQDDNPSSPFAQQVQWELDAQDKADLLLYYFAANSAAPITLLEFGLYAPKKPLVFVSPHYTRAGNVKITARHLGLPTYSDDAALLQALAAKMSAPKP